ncbi:tyrosine--tRNA ligase [Mycoplasmopsis meleagridis]|uniref:tyrosine--tRNA ligase n=1 Tax=Mycoplasmopsis meleagridis TaxID=29561 RepID=UPI00073DAA2A|nr:tyrosine--tRNA ligase [Mycoplasmopsis meleagridis]KUH47443.1 tyrosine--tRNA ligase [Mycoplasmopsis meleagridis]
MTLLEELKWRGILKQISNENKFLSLNPYEIGVYGGFDPSAKSLHLGNYILIATLKRFMQYGYKTFAVVGGATGMIGDPSFKDSERVLLDNRTVLKNKNNIINQLTFHKLNVIDNYEIYKDMNVLDFLRNAGKLVNISNMLAKESVEKRIQRGLSFTEFTYQLLQGYDFLKLYQTKKICIQVGGSDQWGNIITGIDMIEKVEGVNHKALAITLDLLTDENGNKIGKSSGGGSLWLDKELTSPYQMYQYLFNQSDLTCEKLLKWLTFLKIEEIDSLLKKHFLFPKERLAQKVLSYEIVKDIFGKKYADEAQTISNILFNNDFDLLGLKIEELEKIEKYLNVINIDLNSNLINSLIANKIIQSKREAREFINNHSLKIDGENITMDTIFYPKNYQNKYAFFKKGKKQIYLIKAV